VTRRVIDALDGPVVLVGHSYGGTVITEAGPHEKRELQQERKIPYPQVGATKERRKQ
jgi:predicted alpha/beta hydrolase family esterase